MRYIIVLCLVFGIALARPDGHQADLEGRREPRAIPHIQNSEFKTTRYHTQSQSSNDFYRQQTGAVGQTYQQTYPSAHILSANQVSQLQNDLTRKLQELIRTEEERQRASPSTYISSQYLEQQLNQQLNQLLDREISQHYGQEQYNSYQNRDQIQQLKDQLRPELTRQLQNYITLQSSYSTQNRYTSTGQVQIPVDTKNVHFASGSHSANSFGSQFQSQAHVAPGSIPLNDITRQVEIDLINQITRDVASKIESYRRLPSSYPIPNYQSELVILRQDITRKATQELNNLITRYYGTQEKRGLYYYTVTPGVRNDVPNYREDEFASSSVQLQNNLIRTLEEKFREQYNQYSRTSGHPVTTQNHGTTYGTSHGTSNQNYGTVYPTLPQNPQGTYGTTGQYSTNTFIITGNAPAQLQNAVRNLQVKLNHELQTAINTKERRYQQLGYTSQTNYHQLMQRELLDELNRNVTSQLQHSLDQQYGRQGQRGSYYYTISSNGQYNSSPNYDSQQLADLTQQLQNNLVQNLHTYIAQRQSTYSSSSNSGYKGHHVAAAYTHGGYSSYK